MQSTSALYNSIIAGPHNYEVKLTIKNGSTVTTYDNSHIYDITVQGDLFSGRQFGIGGASGRMATMKLYNVGTVPQLAEIKLYVRAINATQQSEWLPKGVYYKSNKTNSEISQSIEAYDVLAKSDNVFIRTGTWSPISVYNLVSLICTDLGCSMSSSTASLLSASSITIDKIPVIGANGTTCRELLKYVAVLFRANWITNDSGELCLIQTGTSSAISLGGGYDQLVLGDAFNPVDRVILWIGDNQAYYAPAGLTDAQWNAMTGQIVECRSPYGTQDIATSLLAGFSSYAPRPLDVYKFQGINMALELGDTISVSQGSNTYTTVLGYQDISLDSLCCCNLGFAVEEAVDNVFSSDTSEKKLGRKVAGIDSRIEVLDDRIDLVVEGEGTSASIKIGAIVDGINSPTSYATITADKVAIDGTTVFSSMLDTTGGTTTIKGGSIKTNSIETNRLIVANQSIGGSSTQLANLGASNIYGNKEELNGTNASLKIGYSAGSTNDYVLLEGINATLYHSDGTVSKTNTWYNIINGGGGGEPSAYIKSASVSGNTLTLTKKDDTTVTFTPVALFG